MDSTLFIAWTMVAAASLTLAVVHALVWLLDRRRVDNLAFCVLAVSVAAIARIEYGMMRAASPQDYAEWLRWIHGAMFFTTASLVLFIRLHFATGRNSLGWTVIALRAIVTLGNVVWPASSAVRPLQWLATTAALLLIVYVLDAALALWRKPLPEARRKAALVGGGIVGFVLIATVQTQLVIWGL